MMTTKKMTRSGTVYWRAKARKAGTVPTRASVVAIRRARAATLRRSSFFRSSNNEGADIDTFPVLYHGRPCGTQSQHSRARHHYKRAATARTWEQTARCCHKLPGTAMQELALPASINQG